jgi:membrane dipeptidase
MHDLVIALTRATVLITIAILTTPVASAWSSPGTLPEHFETDRDAAAASDDSTKALVAHMTDGGHVQMRSDTRRMLVTRDSLWNEALRIHYNAIVMDGHMDTPSLMLDFGYELGHRHVNAHADLPRMKDGGLDAPFFSIWVSTSYGETGEATSRAREMIAEVNRQLELYRDRAELAVTADDVRRITRSGKKAILLGLEGGHILMGSVDTLRALREEGIRYVTLTHTRGHSWADSSQDEPRWNGLNEMGEDLIREMNRLGVLVDISHVSDSTFWDALRISTAPLIASHSSCRALVNQVRNLDDTMIEAMAEKDGVVMINYFDLVTNHRLDHDVMDAVYQRVDTAYGGSLQQVWAATYDEMTLRGMPRGTINDVLDHIDHVVRVAGIDHVGLGSDFDGARMPIGLEDVTRLPWITYGLLKRGYSESDIYKILGGNTLRVLEEAEAVSTYPSD